ncbi:hypothetical protein CVT25_004662 [Psilocybe cyanescens]|uniref:Uncharacterized protein n=1 Tax=Psilocybe cyanescens TaxID=93625 RepID=A0A409XMM4_PSICY|nr:hypothetical protein CVT25_004662 [Psilocybe cyanescens]
MSRESTQLEHEDDGGLLSDTGDDNNTDNENNSKQEEEDEKFVDASDVSLNPGLGTMPLLNLYIQPAEDSFAHVAPPVGASQSQGQSQGPRLLFNLSGSMSLLEASGIVTGVVFGRAGARPCAGSGSGSRPVNL